jgi:hypothetical protein
MKLLAFMSRLFNRKSSASYAAIVTVIASGFALGQQSSASAQAAYGSYIGIGPAVGLTRDENDQGGGLAGVVAARYKFLRAPLSLRGQLFFGNGTAIVPTISYDYPLSWNTDIYLGAGASIPLGGNSVLGDRTSFAIQPGIDYTLPNSDFVLFGNAVISFDGYRNGGTAASLQGGVGLRF